MLRRSLLPVVAILAFVTSSCGNSIFRMNADFNAEALGPPPAKPLPNPPSDSFTWLVGQPLFNEVTQDSSGGNQVRITPLPGFIADPDKMRNALIGTSEPFTTSRPVNMRGKLRVRITGSGDLFFVIRAVRGGRISDALGGGRVTAIFGRHGWVDILRPATDAAFANGVSPLNGSTIAPYYNNHAVTLNWSIDQAGRRFSLSAASRLAPSGADSHSFLLSPGNIEQLHIFIYLHHPQTGMIAHVDDITMEEID